MIAKIQKIRSNIERRFNHFLMMFSAIVVCTKMASEGKSPNAVF